MQVSQGSIFGPLFFFIYISNFSSDLSSNSKLLTDDASLFSVIHNINSKTNDLNSDLTKISNWDFLWKTKFNPDPNKQAQEFDHPPLYLNQNLLKLLSTHKHLRMVLDTRLDFNLHLTHQTYTLR